jgi:hypothetical protein
MLTYVRHLKKSSKNVGFMTKIWAKFERNSNFYKAVQQDKESYPREALYQKMVR